jgi:hypothetical protein
MCNFAHAYFNRQWQDTEKDMDMDMKLPHGRGRRH